MRFAAATIGVASVLLAAGSAFATSSARPSLRLVAGDSIRGLNFVPRERVTIVVNAVSASGDKARATKTVHAGSGGGFTTTLPHADVTGGCTNVEITATGATGDHATYKVVPMCAPPQPTG